ncbi:hypothetical protein ACP3V5_06835 [Vibrio maritimus]
MNALKILATSALTLAIVGCSTYTPTSAQHNPVKSQSSSNLQVQGDTVYLYHAKEKSTFAMKWWEWGTGSKYDTSDDKVISITPGSGWGGHTSALVFASTDKSNNLVPVDASMVDTFKFKVKGNTVSAMKVHVKTDKSSEQIRISTHTSKGKDLGNGWVQMAVMIPSYSNLTQVGFSIPGSDVVQVKDIYLVNADS